jgi:hypothetical protein
MHPDPAKRSRDLGARDRCIEVLQVAMGELDVADVVSKGRDVPTRFSQVIECPMGLPETQDLPANGLTTKASSVSWHEYMPAGLEFEAGFEISDVHNS